MATNNGIVAISALTITLLVSSCASPQEARSKGPVATYTSNKSAKDVSNCIATGLESTAGLTTPVNVRPTPDGYTLQVSSDGNTLIVVDIADEKNGGSSSKYYKGHIFLAGKWDQTIKTCQ